MRREVTTYLQQLLQLGNSMLLQFSTVHYHVNNHLRMLRLYEWQAVCGVIYERVSSIVSVCEGGGREQERYKRMDGLQA